MAAEKRNRWIAIVALVLGVLLALMLYFEIKDGRLYGSKSDGMTLESHPVVFYIGTILQSIIVLILLFSGIAFVRIK